MGGGRGSRDLNRGERGGRGLRESRGAKGSLEQKALKQPRETPAGASVPALIRQWKSVTTEGSGHIIKIWSLGMVILAVVSNQTKV